MTDDIEVHIKNLVEFQMQHSNLRRAYNNKRKPDNRLKDEMDSIRYTCEMYMKRNNLFQYLTFGGSTPQQQSEYNDFDSISDFDEIMEGVIIKLKSI